MSANNPERFDPDKYSAIVCLCQPQGIYNTEYIDVDGEVRVAFTECREDACHMHHVVDVVLLDKPLVFCRISHVKPFIFAWKVKFLLDYICRDDIVGSQLLAKCPDKWHTDLTLAACDQDPTVFPRNDGLVRLHFLRLCRICRLWKLHECWSPNGESAEVGYAFLEHIILSQLVSIRV